MKTPIAARICCARDRRAGDLVRNVFEIRAAIEPIFIHRFCERATAQDIARLRDAAADFAAVAAGEPPDFEALDAANGEFHAIIIEGETNIPAIEAMERYAGLINATRASCRSPRQGCANALPSMPRSSRRSRPATPPPPPKSRWPISAPPARTC